MKLVYHNYFKPFIVFNESFYQFDLNHGYKYIPSKQVLAVEIVDQKVASYWTVRIDPVGNVSGNSNEDVVNWKPTDKKLLVFGDSFTANPSYGGIAWPDYLPEAVAKLSNTKPTAINYGRDGYGVLQMLGLAADEVKRHTNVTGIIIAFITDDLPRDRFWRTSSIFKGIKRTFRLTFPFPSEIIPGKYPDVCMINTRVNEEWAKSLIVCPNSNDQLLKDIVNQHYDLFRDNAGFSFWSFTNSYLFERLFIPQVREQWSIKPPVDNNLNDSQQPEQPIPRSLGLNDLYEIDRKFKEDIETLTALRIPVLFIHLPSKPEMYSRKYLYTNEQLSLFKSLNKIINDRPTFRLIQILDHMSVPNDNIESLFIRSYDPHPSIPGAKLYAAAIASSLKKQGIINATESACGLR